MNAEASATSDDPSFDDFWLLWPRKVAKKEALREWVKLSVDKQVAAIIGLVEWRRVWAHRAAEREDFYDFLVYPCRWLKYERWEDEIPSQYRRMNGNGAAFIAPAEPGVRSPMPDHVLSLIADLRAKNGHRSSTAH